MKLTKNLYLEPGKARLINGQLHMLPEDGKIIRQKCQQRAEAKPKLCPECKVRHITPGLLYCSFCDKLTRHRAKRLRERGKKNLRANGNQVLRCSELAILQRLILAFKDNKFYKVLKKGEIVLASKEKVLRALKVRVGCQKCGYQSYYSGVYDFHHRGGKTEWSFSLSRLKPDITWHELIEDLARCTILCANCHRLAHKGKRPDIRKRKKRTRVSKK